jgi:dolichol-phosphate mannosyltransferase
MNLISIILPTYNEAENIIPLIKEIDKTVKDKKEIIVVDDNSPDGTSNVVKEYAKKHKHVKLETRYHDRGLTNSIQHGIHVSKGDIIVWMDCDFSHPPSVIPSLLKKIEEGYDVAVASRFVAGGKAKSEGPRDSLIGIILSNILNFFMQFLLGNKFYDYTSGFVAVKRVVFQNITLRGDYGEYFIDFIVRVFRQKFRVVEIPFISQSRRAGESKTGGNLLDYIARGRKYIIVVIRLLYENIFSYIRRY